MLAELEAFARTCSKSRKNYPIVIKVQLSQEDMQRLNMEIKESAINAPIDITEDDIVVTLHVQGAPTNAFTTITVKK